MLSLEQFSFMYTLQIQYCHELSRLFYPMGGPIMSMVDAVVYPYIARRKIQKLQKWRILIVSPSFRLAGVKNSNQANGLSTLLKVI